MGTTYSVACLDCKIYRDLDKHMGFANKKIFTRKDALDFSETEIKKNPFRYGLLVSFLLEHIAHNCKFYSEHEEDYGDSLDEIMVDGVVLKPEKRDFWGINEI